jgi:hypothetical protein
MNRILQIPPRWVGLAALCLLSLVYLALFHYNRFGIDEGAAHGLLLDWTIGSEKISAVATFGFPDLRALLFAPLNFNWVGDLTAAKVLTMYLTFATALMLYRWAEKTLDDETALFATGLWLVAPLTIAQTDSIGTGNYLAFCAIASYWLDQYLRASTRTISGYYFIIVMVMALAVSMHPAGLGMALAMAWSWWRHGGGNARRRYAMIGGLGVFISFVLFSRMGWPEVETFQPMRALAGILIGDLSYFKSLPIGFALVSAVLLLLSAIAAVKRSRDVFSMMLITGLVVGLIAPDHGWAQLALLLILYEGIKALITLNSRVNVTSVMARRGLVAVAVFALSFLFMIGDKEHFLLKEHHRLQPTDQVISDLARLTSATSKPIYVASQWPARTMLATRRDAFPILRPVKDDPEAYLKRMQGITYMVFDQYDNRNKLLRRVVAELSDRIQTIAILKGGVILQLPPSKKQQKR